MAGGKLVKVEETGAPAGTRVAVQDLFYNLPARRKFLRKTSTETDHIVDTVARQAMAFTHITFRLDENTRPLLSLPRAASPRMRVSQWLGTRVAEAMVEAEAAHPPAHR